MASFRPSERSSVWSSTQISSLSEPGLKSVSGNASIFFLSMSRCVLSFRTPYHFANASLEFCGPARSVQKISASGTQRSNCQPRSSFATVCPRPWSQALEKKDLRFERAAKGQSTWVKRSLSYGARATSPRAPWAWAWASASRRDGRRRQALWPRPIASSASASASASGRERLGHPRQRPS